MPKEQWLRRQFVYYYFIDKGIPPREVDEMNQMDIDIQMLINKFVFEKMEWERKKSEVKTKHG
jgi:hypothetical protein